VGGRIDQLIHSSHGAVILPASVLSPQCHAVSTLLIPTVSQSRFCCRFQGCHAAILDRLYEYMPLILVVLAIDFFQVSLPAHYFGDVILVVVKFKQEAQLSQRGRVHDASCH